MALSYKEIREITQSRRLTVIEAIGGETGEAVPDDPKLLKVYLQALNDADKAEQIDRRLEIEEDVADTSKLAVETAALMAKQLTGNPFQTQPSDGPTLPTDAELGQHEHVPGAGQIGVVMETSKDFLARMAEPMAQRDGTDVEIPT